MNTPPLTSVTSTLVPTQPAILGHQGGWDEMLLVATPLAVVGLALWVANKRVSAQLKDSQPEHNATTDSPGNEHDGIDNGRP